MVTTALVKAAINAAKTPPVTPPSASRRLATVSAIAAAIAASRHPTAGRRGPTTTYSIVTLGPYSTTTGASPVPYLTGAFAGTGGFTVSPILGYQAGGFNPNGTPDTVSRQFQAGLSVTGQGASQNATLFVMTSQINSSPNIGYNQGGGFVAVTMRNPAQWYGLGYGAASSATPTSAPNSVPNSNGTPNAGYTIFQYVSQWQHRRRNEQPIVQLSANWIGELQFQSDNYGNADDFGEQPPEPDIARLRWRIDGDGDPRRAL